MRMFWEFCDFLYIAMIKWLIIRHAWSAILWHDRIQACDIYLQELTDCHQLWISIAPDEGVTLTWHRQPQYWHTFADRSCNVLCLWLSKVSANAFSHWLRPCPEADRKWPRKIYCTLHKQLNAAWFRCSKYSISQEMCTWLLLCCALLWLYIDWFSHIHQAYFTGTVAI